MAWLLDINDTQLSLYKEQTLVYQQPAVALWQVNELIFGHGALAQARLHPQQVNNLYIERMSDEPLPRALGGARNHADLVYRQFQLLAEQVGSDPLNVAVSANFSAQQLGAMLGIATEADLQLTRFIDTALLQMASSLNGRSGQTPRAFDLNEPVWVLDVQLHNLLLSRFEMVGSQLQRVGFESISGSGLISLLEGWLNVVADQFISATRFDPLHAAMTEQQVYDQLYQWLTQSTQPNELSIVVSQGDDVRRVEVPLHLLATKTQSRAAAVADRLSAEAQVVLTPRAAAIPGISALLGECLQFELGAASLPLAFAALIDANHLPETQGVGFVTTLELPEHWSIMDSTETWAQTAIDASVATGPMVDTAPVSEDSDQAVPTHGLLGHAAVPVVSLVAPLAYRSVNGRPSVLPGFNLVLNGQPVTAQEPLSCGDVLRVGEQDYRLIQVS